MNYYHDITKLEKAGYTVVQKSPWHWQVKKVKNKKGDTDIINIWPTKKKYMREFGGGASVYTDVVTAVAELIGLPHEKADARAMLKRIQAEEEALITPEQRERQALIEWWRGDTLGRLAEYSKSI